MADASWFLTIESKVFTVVGTRVRNALANRTPAITIAKLTTNNASNTTAKFPTWYMHEMDSVEIGRDLDGKTVNAVMNIIEVIVYAKDSAQCKAIMDETVLQFKQLRYELIATPIRLNDASGVYRSVAKFRRPIGADEIDNL